MMKRLLTASAAAILLFAAPAVQAQELQGRSLLGEPLYVTKQLGFSPETEKNMLRAAAEAKAAYEQSPTVDNATWYQRLLMYQNRILDSVAVLDAALKLHPGSGKLLRHRAQRYLTLRQFDKSIEDGLAGVKAYGSQPLERERPGPSYFPGAPDMVQMYLFYHLGQAYFGKHDFDNAQKWFAKAREVAAFSRDDETESSTVYWLFLCAARAGRTAEARVILDGYNRTLFELYPKGGSDTYFDGIQLFKGNRPVSSMFSTSDGGQPFATGEGVAASTSYSIAQYYLLMGEREKAKPWLARAILVKSWGYFARIQAEADWTYIFPGEDPAKVAKP
jgi:tetratricopeptide (TPR) repeat protein